MKKLLTITLIVLAAGLTSSRAQNTWTQKADFGGIARSSAATFSIGDKGYLGTGTTPTVSVLFKDFWEYDPAADTWTQKADFGGGERAAAVGLSINGKGYIGTGFSGSFWGTYYNDFWEYDPVTNAWTKKADFAGVPRSEAGGFSIGNKGYIGTGFTYTIYEYYSDFWEYDPVSDVWTKKADFAGGGWADPAAFSIGNKGYMGTGWKNGLSASFYEYDPTTDTWTKKANYGGGAIQYSVGFSIGNKGYIGTGVDKAIFYEYDPALDKWTKKADYGGGGVNVAAGFSVGNKGYIGTGQTNVALKSFWEYTPDYISNALDFDGVDDYISLPVSFGGPEWKELTVEAWVKVDGMTPDIQAIFSSNQSGEWVHFQMLENNQGNNVAYIPNGVVYLPNIPKTLGEWKHVAMVIKSGDSRLYVNGVQVGVTATTTFNYINSANAVDIGRGYNKDRHMNGKIDELRVWNVARTAAEIQANMNTSICSNATGLVAYYPFNQGIAGEDNAGLVTAEDLSTNNEDGTLKNFALIGSNSNWVADVPLVTPVTCEDDICVSPIGLNMLDITATSAELSWNDNPDALGYVIKYNTEAENNKAKVTYSKSNSKPIFNLEPNTTYFWRVKSVCSEDPKVVSEWSEKYYFTTAPFKIGDEHSTSLTLFPNPVSEQFTLNLQTGSTNNQSASIYLLNVLGQTAYSSQEMVNGELTKVITMPGTAASGWYVVRVVMSDQVIENKLLYQK
jgi:hypothetical protein